MYQFIYRVDTLVVPTSWLLWRKLQCACESSYFYKIFTSVPLEIYPKAELLNHTLVLLFFGVNSILFSMWLHRVAFLLTVTNQRKGFPFLYTYFYTCSCLFDNSHSRCEVISHCGFELHFPDICHSEHLFMYLLESWGILKERAKNKKSQEIQVKDNGMENQSLAW